MSFRAHGKWCGPGWSAGQWKDAKDLTEEDKQVPADDELDQACKEHDIGIAEGDPKAHEKFYKKAAAAGWFGLTLAQFVKIAGPPLQNYLRGGQEVNEMLRKRDKRKAQGYQRDEHAKRVIAENEDDDLEAGLSFVGGVEDATREHAQDQRVISALTSLGNPRASMEDDPEFITPLRNRAWNQSPSTPPTIEERPLRGPREQGSLTNLLNQVDNQEKQTSMDEPMEVMAMSSRALTTTESGNPAKNKSVMVRYDARQEMGFLTETRTAMLPLSIYFSINKLDSSTPVVFQFVLNDTYDIFRKVDLQTQTFPTLGGTYSSPNFSISGDVTTSGNISSHNITNNLTATATVASAGYTAADAYNLFAVYNSSSKTHVSRSKGVSADMAYSIYAPSAHGMKIIKPVGINVGNAVQFPATVKSSVAGTTTTTNSGKMGYASSPNGVAANGDYAMAWRNYYERIYRNRHVMKTEWKLTMENAQEGAYHRGVVLEAVDTITSEVTSPNYVTPTNRSLAEMLRYKRIKETRLDSFNAQGGSVVNVLSGSWTPNDNRRRDVVDEELITTWYPTKNKNGPATKFWEEFQTLLFYNDQMSNNQSGYFNCRLDLLYHVQYRDLSNEYRYPDPESTTTMLQIRDTCFPVFRPTPGTGWPTIEDPNLQGAVNISSAWNQATK